MKRNDVLMKTEKIFGYARISTNKQKIERQIENIKREYPQAEIIQEVFTGTKCSRPKFNKLLKEVRQGDTIVFDSVSRMSRNAEEGFETYMELYNRGVNLIFLKESTVNTDAFRSVLGEEQLTVKINTNDTDTDKLVNGIMKEVATYITSLARKQIKLAFEQSEKEVADLHQRTAEGIREAKRQGKQVGRATGQTVITAKEKQAKELIRKFNKSFGGSLNDLETIDLIKGRLDTISRNSYYKYKAKVKQEIENN